MDPCAVGIFEWGNGQSWGFVVEELSVDPPPFFGVAREFFELCFEFVGVVVVGSGECVVRVFACVVVVVLSLLGMFDGDGSFAGVSEPGVSFLRVVNSSSRNVRLSS